MTDYVSFFLNNSGGAMQLQCIEISHPTFDTLCYVRDDTDGLSAGGIDYEYRPMSIKRNNVSNDLEQTVSVTLADVDDAVFKKMLNIPKSSYSHVSPKVNFKIYADDDLTEPLIALQTLEVATISKDSEALITFDAQAPELNNVKTGRVYTLDNNPLLRGI